ncbi:MAG: hypothetical protein GF315_09845 [candidate division Zixibacteria bacterium]|nr:hypothetical protein [candidate division Zixibacteria bacterium]
MYHHTIIPKVDETQEFIEISNDFANPLDIVREAISNAFDANAEKIEILFDMIEDDGERVLRIRLNDDGEGMDLIELQSFFDLGNSTRRCCKKSIGEKGHGTKVYFNSSLVEVKTYKQSKSFVARMEEPYRKLYRREIPEVNVEVGESDSNKMGTEITILKYFNNRREKFTHEILKDHILWFTKFGSFEHMVNENTRNVTLYLQGLNRNQGEVLQLGHVFPDESKAMSELLDIHLVDAPRYFCKHITKSGHLENFPEIRYDMIISIEGNRIKQAYNPMLRRKGYQAPKGAYTVQERYGLWLCKDFIPIQRKNEWVISKGSEYTKLHAFFNCQDFRLTANRSSIENTPSEILQDIRNEIGKIYKSLRESDEWREMEWLEEEAEGFRSSEKEKKDYEKRIRQCLLANVAIFKEHEFVEPRREIGVYSIVVKLSLMQPDLFPFEIVDYDTYVGIDVLAKEKNNTPISRNELRYIEFKHFLTHDFNHSFANLHSIVCWDTKIKHGELLDDINGEQRKMVISTPDSGNYTKYFLDNPRKAHKIEVFVLKDYLKEKLNLEFRPRSDDS